MRNAQTIISSYVTTLVLPLAFALILPSCSDPSSSSLKNAKELVAREQLVRERILLDKGWKFKKYADGETVDKLIYDVLPEVTDSFEGKQADSKPTEAVKIETRQDVLKPWILPTANQFIKDPTKHYQRPTGNPGSDFPFVQADFDDNDWESVSIPHDWAITGPFMQGDNVRVGGGMGRLPSVGTGWYRKKLEVPTSDKGKTIYLDVGGAMSYAMVWLNGHLVGGWPYGYASWRLNLTPHLKFGEENQLAIRLNNPKDSSRWYQGGGLYRDVWLTKTQPTHIGLWGTHVYPNNISDQSANIDLEISVENHSEHDTQVASLTEIYELNEAGVKSSKPVAEISTEPKTITAQTNTQLKGSIILQKPRLWGPLPQQKPNRYVAITTLKSNGKKIDQYETRFGIRSLKADAEKGLLINGEKIYIQGVNQHHDLGALGAAFNYRAAERQLEKLREMGVNAIRLAHNPPARDLLELTDKMGFLVVDEIFDVWERKKAPLDFHLIFPEWYEADLRSFIRRDRNHPSVIMWSVGNEVGEQYTDLAGAEVGRSLHNITKEEDPSRPTAASMNYAKPHMPLPAVFDTISLNYQGEGIRNAPAYKHLQGIRTVPLYPSFHETLPNKLIYSSENAAAVSSRGEYIFPVTPEISAPIEGKSGGDPDRKHVSSYELYTAQFGSSADKVLASLARHPYVAGGFIWSGWDYLGEPTPYYSSRSSYFGVIDLAGFAKDRFYLYQSAWRPDHPMAHILPHWNWPDRVGQITPVHVFTSGDEAELFLNGKSLGRKQKQTYEYRLRWDDVIYEPGELKVITYKNNKEWAIDSVKTTGKAHTIILEVDRDTIKADGKDLAFISVRLVDRNGHFVANANNKLHFSIDGPGELVATDNGDPTDMQIFSSLERSAFNGLALGIVRAEPDASGEIMVSVSGESLESARINIQTTQ